MLEEANQHSATVLLSGRLNPIVAPRSELVAPTSAERLIGKAWAQAIASSPTPLYSLREEVCSTLPPDEVVEEQFPPAERNLSLTLRDCPSARQSDGSSYTHHLVPMITGDQRCIYCHKTSRELRAENS